MPDHKHLTLDHRSFIQASPQAGYSFRRIALALNKDPTAISNEVRNRRTLTLLGLSGGHPTRVALSSAKIHAFTHLLFAVPRFPKNRSYSFDFNTFSLGCVPFLLFVLSHVDSMWPLLLQYRTYFCI